MRPSQCKMFARTTLAALALLLHATLIGCDKPDPLSTPVAAAVAINAPFDLVATAVSQSQVDLRWSSNSSHVIGFELYRATNSVFSLRATTGDGVTAYSDTGLSPSTQYCYKVRAIRRNGQKITYSEFSPIACVTTPAPPPPPAPPDAPSWLDASPASSTDILIRWFDNATNEDGFRVERSLDGGATWITAATTGAAVGWSSAGDGGRTSDEPVCYRAIAFNAAGDSPYSNTDCATPPAAPSDLFVTPIDEQLVTLTWTDNSAVEEGYEVWDVVPNGGPVIPWDLIAILPANSTSIQTGTCTGAVYGCNGYAVRAVKDGGYSEWVIVVTVPIFP